MSALEGTKLRVEASLPATAEVARQARLALQPLSGALPDARFDDLRLLITELVTNSLRHARPAGRRGGSTIDLRVDVWREGLYAEVLDSGTVFDPSPAPRPLEEGGLGLHLVRQLASRWGIRRVPGTCVWFEIDA